MKLRTLGSALCRNRGQTDSAFPSRTRATAARAWRWASRSLASAGDQRPVPDRGRHRRALRRVRLTDHATGR